VNQQYPRIKLQGSQEEPKGGHSNETVDDLILSFTENMIVLHNLHQHAITDIVSRRLIEEAQEATRLPEPVLITRQHSRIVPIVWRVITAAFHMARANQSKSPSKDQPSFMIIEVGGEGHANNKKKGGENNE
jgi:hypothetical protein